MNQPIKRYDRVKNILKKAAGDSTAVYGGEVPFWELPYEEFLTCEIYGVRMIAPAEPESATPPSSNSSCCGCSNENPVNIASDRGKESGLIRGLKGEPPYDGKPFARLPWGGREVKLEDILFIQDWIDDGCPPEEELTTISLTSDIEVTSKSIEVSENVFIYKAGDAFSDQSSNKRIRMNLDCLPPDQVEIFRQGVREMYHLNKFPADWRNYNSIALIHQNHCQHAWERFLPWHRVYLYEFERALSDVINLPFGIPYWDWTMPQYKDGDLKKGSDVIPPSFKAFLTKKSIETLGKETKLDPDQLHALSKLIGLHFTSQQTFFAAVKKAIGEDPMKYRERFIDVLLASNSLWYPLRYPAEFFTSDGKPSTINDVIHYHYPSADDIAQIQSLKNFRDYGGGSNYDNSYGFLDQNPHNTIHIWSGGQNPQWDATKHKKGVNVAKRNYHKREELYSQPQYGDMFSNLTASFDPIFWPHHVNVDRLWAEWQVENPNCNPADPTSILTPWNYTVGDTYDHRKFGYEYLKSVFRFPVGMNNSISRFTSQAVAVPDAALKEHKSVEVRLNQVPQLPLSCYVRAFINQPDANAKTPIQDNPHYAGYLAIFGHGECYGGPGHCDIPPAQAAPYDLREQALHNRPRNHRIDATSCVDKLIEAGASEFQVTLVIVGVDGEEIKDLLHLESVSFNFKD